MRKNCFREILLLSLLPSATLLNAQNVGINTTGAIPSVNAILDLNTGNAQNLGLLIPRVVLGSSLTTFSPPLANAPTGLDSGMMVYNWQATNQPIGYYCWNGTNWMNISAATNQWQLIGNAGTIPGTNFLGTTDNNALILKTFNAEGLRITSSGTNGVPGNVGISNTNPTTLMQVANGGASGKLSVYSQDNQFGQLQIGNPASNAEASIGFISGVTAFGDVASSVNGPDNIWAIGAGCFVVGGNKFCIYNEGYNGDVMVITSAGFMGISTTTPNQELELGGNNTERIDGLITGNTFNSSATTTATNLLYTNNATGDVYALPTINNAQLVTSATGVPSWQTAGANGIDWSLTGNAGTTPGTNFIGTTDANGFMIKTDNTERAFFTGAATGITQMYIKAGSAQTITSPLMEFQTSGGADLMDVNADNNTDVFMGYQAGWNNNSGGGANSNVFIGWEAGYANTTAENNTAVGWAALTTNTAVNNTAFGNAALQFNTTGSLNTAVGNWALTSNTTGGANTAVGNAALENNTTGGPNTALGDIALENNITGSTNSAVGSASLEENISGNDNTAVGHIALRDNQTGNDNIAIGSAALNNNISGSKSTAVGDSALYNNLEGNMLGIGYEALYNNTTGTINQAEGYQALYNNTTGSNNTGIGYKVLYSNTVLRGNIAIGDSALYTQSFATAFDCGNIAIGNSALFADQPTATSLSGDRNTALGEWALRYNTQGYDNNALGYNALYANTTGFANTAIGKYALQYNTTGSYSTATGTNALQYNTIGSGNTANGEDALESNTTGSNNTANGFLALESNTTGNSNIANGYEALFSNTTGDANTAIGSYALLVNIPGSINTAVGDSALYSSNGSKNSALGYQATVSPGFSGSTAIGYQAVAGENNAVILGNLNDEVGVGTTTPNTLMQVGNGGTTGKLSVYTKDNDFGQFQVGNPTSNAEASIGFISGVTAFGDAATSTNGASNIWIVGAGPYGIGGNNFGISNSAYGGNIMTVTSTGYVGIGTTTPTYPLTITSTVTTNYSNYEYMNDNSVNYENGNSGNIPVSLYAQGRILCASEIDVTSDKRLKDSIGNISPEIALAAITKLQPVHFKWKKDASEDRALIAGFFAQQVHEIIPEAVTIMSGTHFQDEHTLNYDMLTTYAIAAIQQQQKLIDEQKNSIDELKRENQELKQNQINASVNQQTSINEMKQEIETLKQQMAALGGNSAQTASAQK